MQASLPPTSGAVRRAPEKPSSPRGSYGPSSYFSRGDNHDRPLRKPRMKLLARHVYGTVSRIHHCSALKGRLPSRNATPVERPYVLSPFVKKCEGKPARFEVPAYVLKDRRARKCPDNMCSGSPVMRRPKVIRGSGILSELRSTGNIESPSLRARMRAACQRLSWF